MTRILVAGIGNIFNRDDGFGVEVVQRLARRLQPHAVKVMDIGIRGIDLTYALLEQWDVAILVDAAVRGHAPGTVSIVEPDAPRTAALAPEDVMISGHDLDPAKVMQVVTMLGGNYGRILLVACEPADLGGEDGAMGLTPPVAAAIEPAVAAVERLIAQILKDASAAVAA